MLAGLKSEGPGAADVRDLRRPSSTARVLVMEYLEGRIVATADDALALAPDERDAVCASLVDALARLHRVDVGSAGLGGWAGRRATCRGSGPLDRAVELLQTVPAGHGGAPGPDRGGAATAAGGPPWSLVHGDYRLDNVILAPAGPEVLAVLDWEMPTLGDPLADLALTLVYWTEADDRLRHRVPVAEHLTDADGFGTGPGSSTPTPRRRAAAWTTWTCARRSPASSWPLSTESIHVPHAQRQQLGAAAGDVHAMGVGPRRWPTWACACPRPAPWPASPPDRFSRNPGPIGDPGLPGLGIARFSRIPEKRGGRARGAGTPRAPSFDPARITRTMPTNIRATAGMIRHGGNWPQRHRRDKRRAGHLQQDRERDDRRRRRRQHLVDERVAEQLGARGQGEDQHPVLRREARQA